MILQWEYNELTFTRQVEFVMAITSCFWTKAWQNPGRFGLILELLRYWIRDNA